ncbi:MAG TPA: DUF4350 domain-containing protein [Candidatus Acidoferrum sp.]|nr:DUF4350 domain-containing protein [Candidatus Acidoferrum sp.]
MPVGIAPSDRKLLLAGGVLLLLMLTASAVLAPPADQQESPVPSTYSAQSEGAKAAYLLLAHLHYPVRRWENPPTELDPDSRKTLLILAGSWQPPSKAERQALENFVLHGGHVLFTGASFPDYFPAANISHLSPDPDWKSYSPNLPSRLTRGAVHISLRPQANWGKLEPSQLVLYGEASSPVVVSWKLGEGQILWWGSSSPLTNLGITRDDNLAFFLNSVSNWSAGKPYTIYWDEYFHGQRSSLWSYVGRTSLAWGGVQLVLLGLALLLTFSRRSGPIYLPAEVSRLSPLEFVDTLGGLYERAGAASSAVSVSYTRLRTLLSRQLGFSANTPNAQIAEAAEQRLGWKDSGLADLLRRSGAATRVDRMPDSEALDLVQKLEHLAARLTIRAQFRREKT